MDVVEMRIVVEYSSKIPIMKNIKPKHVWSKFFKISTTSFFIVKRLHIHQEKCIKINNHY